MWSLRWRKQIRELSMRSMISRRLLIFTASSVLICALILVFANQLLAGGQVTLQPGDNIQAAVQRASSGTTFQLQAGVYRFQSIVPKDGDTFVGEPGTVLTGAQVLSDFTHQGQNWMAKVHAEPSEPRGQCAEDAPACSLPEDLFIDDKPLRRSPNLEGVTAGKWYLDYDGGQLYLADDPTGHKVEISLTRHAFSGTARNVTIRGLTVEKYANPALSGAIHGAVDPPGPAGQGWIIEDNEVRFNHGEGIYIGQQGHVLHNNLHDNGQFGIVGSGRNILIDGNEIAHNNYAGFNYSWGGGGSKFVFTNGLIVRNNKVHDNEGPGLWTDIENANVLYENNSTSHNKVAGIFHEISYDAVIRNNTVEDDGYNPKGSGPWWGAGIVVSASANVEVYGNHLINCMNGIVGLQDERGNSKVRGSKYLLRNLHVHDNEITQAQGVAAALVAKPSFGNAPFSGSNNRFEHNTYHLADSKCKCFDWAGKRVSKDEWRGQGLDRDRE
jgi:parallel beta-helix repeat protein